jgi:hypothetical protein
MPTLKRKIARAAHSASAKLQTSRLAGIGASTLMPSFAKCCVTRNMVWMENQTARLSTTPTTAAVMADRAPDNDLLPRSCSM